MKKKRKRLIDQIYNGAFENAEVHKDTKKAFYGAGIIVFLGLLVNYSINKKNEFYK